MFLRYLSALFFTISLVFGLHAQTAFLEGEVRDDLGVKAAYINVVVPSEDNGTITDANGKYRIEIPANQNVVVVFQGLNY